MARYTSYPTAYSGLGLSPIQQGISSLQSSLAYRQAGIEGKKRMENLIGMGLAPQTDISKVLLEGMTESRMPIYSAPLHQSWGTWSGFGPTEEEKKERKEARTQRTIMNRGGDAQLAQQASISFTPPERSLGTSAESPLAFTGFGRTIGESAYRTPTIPQTIPSPIPSGTTGMLTSFGGIPRFPFSNY